MRYIALFEDNPAAGETIRADNMSDHLAFLERHKTSIRAAGPLREPDGIGAGGLWVVEADAASDVQKLVEEDPFWPKGLRKSVRILEWKQVFADGRRLIGP